MVSLLLMSEREREMQILKMAFEQRHFRVVLSQPNYANFVKMQQYLPDIILMELPRMSQQAIHFVELVRRHKKTRKVPIISYGDPLEASVKRGVTARGINNYFERPLKFSAMLQPIESYLRKVRKMPEEETETSTKEKDIELILSPDTLPVKKIELISKHVASCMAFPFTVAKVLHMADSEKAAAGDLAKVITSDPVIATHLLKVSNSVLFASLNRRINSIKDAIVRIGFNETKRIVMGMSVMKLFDTGQKSLGFDRIDFWYHSLAVALICERIARRMDKVDPEEAFLAGLLHDFGIIIFDEFFPTIFAATLDKTTNGAGRFIDAEKELLKITHNDVIGELFSSWKIPDNITQGVLGQYAFNDVKENIETSGRGLALCIAIGDIMAKTLYIGAECDQYVQPLDNWVFSVTRIATGFTDAIIDDIYHDVEVYRQFLGLEKREFPERQNDFPDVEKMSIGIFNPRKDRCVLPQYWLKKEGFTIVPLPAGGSYTAFDTKIDLVAVWGRDSITPDQVQPVSSIVRRGGNGDDAGGKPEFAPLLVFHQPDYLPGKGADLENVSCMPDFYDIRQLEETMMQVLEGKVVKCEATEKPAAKQESAESAEDEAASGEEKPAGAAA